MPDPQGLCDYSGRNDFIGGDYTTSRGVQPGVFRLRMAAEPTVGRNNGPLTLSFGSQSMTFQNCATAPYIQRIRKGRNAYEWSVKVYDKRWKWRWPRISGHYNIRQCDQLIDPTTSKSLGELIFLLLAALGETSAFITQIPGVFPEVKWDKAYAGRELELLCDWAGLVICPQLDGMILIERMGSGASLPLPPRDDNISPLYTYNQTVMPSQVAVRTGPTVFQSLINLQAVGLEADGTIRPLNNLTYMPAAGWSRQWFTTFPDVAVASRHLAFQTVWRWYRLFSQESVTGVAELQTMRNLKIMERLAEAHSDDFGIGRCPYAVIKGIYWPLSDLKVNTSADTKYSGSFRVIPELSLIAFEYPVVKWTSDLLDAATLQLWVAYNAVGADGSYLDETVVRTVPEAITATYPRIEKRPYLKRIRNFASPYGATNADNLFEVTAEADQYLNNVVSTYSGGPMIDMFWGGFLPINLSGRIAQVHHRWGNGRVATTRASENHEFDVTQKSHQERRRVERLGQLFDRVMES